MVDYLLSGLGFLAVSLVARHEYMRFVAGEDRRRRAYSAGRMPFATRQGPQVMHVASLACFAWGTALVMGAVLGRDLGRIVGAPFAFAGVILMAIFVINLNSEGDHLKPPWLLAEERPGVQPEPPTRFWEFVDRATRRLPVAVGVLTVAVAVIVALQLAFSR